MLFEYYVCMHMHNHMEIIMVYRPNRIFIYRNMQNYILNIKIHEPIASKKCLWILQIKINFPQASFFYYNINQLLYAINCLLSLL